MSCGVIDRRSGTTGPGCRLRGSTTSLKATASGPGTTGGASGLTNAASTGPGSTSGGGPGTNMPPRPTKPCCFCWCCCCSCSWNKCLVKGVDDNGPTRNPSNDIICEGEPPPTLEEIRNWGKSFDQLMKSAAGRKVFRDFLRCEYSEENILFWLACEELKRESNPDAVEERARFIYEDYISILSPKEVSLDSQVREIVNRNMIEPTPHTFDEAQLQIYTLMHRDSYPRFVNSPLFKTLAQLNNGNSGSSSITAAVGSGPGTGGGAEGSLTTDAETASTKAAAEPASSSIRAESTPTTSATPSRAKSMTPSRASIGSPSAQGTVSQTEVSVFIFDMTSGGTESMTTTTTMTTTTPVSRVIETMSTCNESTALDINYPPPDNISVCSDSSAAQKRVDTVTTSSEPSESTTITTTTATIAAEHSEDLIVSRVATASSEQSTQSASPTVQAIAVSTTPQKINDSASG